MHAESTVEERGDPGNLGISVSCRGQGSELTGRPSERFRAVKEGGRRESQVEKRACGKVGS